MSALEPVAPEPPQLHLHRTPSGGAVREWSRNHPAALALLGSLVLGALSCVIWKPLPGFDVQSWINWGWSASHAGTGGFVISGGPSWKPFPVLLTTLYGLIGRAAPTLWVATARAGGILGLAAIFRLSSQLTDRAGLPRWGGFLAGIVGCAALIMTAPNGDGNWPHSFFRGTVDPSLIAVWLWAVDALFRRRHLLAYTLVAVAGLMRPEAWVFLFAYGLWLWFHHPRLRIWVVLCLLVEPAAWFLPPGLSTGHPLMAATNAHSFNGMLGPHWLGALLVRAYQLQSVPVLVLAMIATLKASSARRGSLALWRASERSALLRSPESLALSLAALSVTWWLVVIVETAAGYPGLQRFFFPATATVCVLSGLGAAEVASFADRWASGSRAAFGRRRGSASVVAVASTVALLAISYPFVTSRLAFARIQTRQLEVGREQVRELQTAIVALGGTRALLPCSSSHVDINNIFKPQLAWLLRVPLARVNRLRKPAVMFVSQHTVTLDGKRRSTSSRSEVRPLEAGLKYQRHLGRWGDWSVYQVYRDGRTPTCVGS